jgi:transcriptional regulator with XRE-family HTH domain
MTTLSERLQIALNRDQSLSQAGLAKACGVKPPSVSDWLSGKTKKIEGANLLMAAQYLSVDAWWLATGKGAIDPSKPQMKLDIGVHAEPWPFTVSWERINKLNAEQKAHINGMIEGYLSGLQSSSAPKSRRAS